MANEINILHHFRYENGRLYKKLKSKPLIGKEELMQTIDLVGYRRLRIEKQYYFEHRIVYTMFNGAIKKGMHIDHINGIKSDNRIENLRLATVSQNLANSKDQQNKTGFKGVHKNRTGNKFYVLISFNKKKHRIGSFDTKEQAFEVYKQKNKELFGAFSKYAF